MSYDLDALGTAYGAFAIVLDRSEVMFGKGTGEQGFGEDVRSGDGILQGYVDANAADRRHGVGGVTDAKQAR